ncbi:MAG TPA: hypothetical protein VEK08_02995 [Planctomycetota bacterium]|nr:hypothetical protein [Planctomycetota bacterium]
MDFKKNLFWIAVAVVLVAGIGGYAFLVSGVKSEDGKSTADLKSDAMSKIDKIKSLAKKADDKNNPDQLMNPEHVKLAREYGARLDGQLKAIQDTWKPRKLDLRYSDYPTDSATKFDNWLSEKRDKIIEAAAKANLQLPADTDKLLFKEPSTDENSADVTRHRDFRLKQLAIVDEIVSLMTRKYGKQQVLKFEPKEDTQEPHETVDVGPQVLERVTVFPSRSWLGTKTVDPKSAGVMIAEERARQWTDDAIKRSGRQVSTAKGNYAELPYSFSSIDIQFVTPLNTVPAVVQALESSNRYTGVVTRVDYARATAPFPSAADPKVATPGPVPMLNTHYQEAPVRVLVSLDLYEYDAAKEAAMAAKAEAPADPKKDGKKDPKKK